MDEKIEAEINNLGARIDVIESLNKALISALLGDECLTQKDAHNFLYLLEDRINDLKSKHNGLIEDLKI